MKKRADGRYQLSIMVGYNENGTPKRKLVYGKTQKEVTEKAADLRVKQSRGLVINDTLTVSEWADIWLDTYKTGIAYNTKKMYCDVVRKYIKLPLGNLKIKDVKTAQLQNIVNELCDRPRTAKLFKLTTSQMFKQAIANDILFKNPAEGIALPTATPKHTKRALTEEEMQKIFALNLDKRTRCLVLLLMYTGMRKGEALAIKKSDINFETNEIVVNKSLVVVSNKSTVKESPKTAAGIRSIPLLAPLKPVLFEYVTGLKTEFLFTTQSGDTMSHIAYRRLWQKFERALDSKEVTAHIFRHNFATILYNAGVDVKAAQTILGHKNISITLGIYTHLDGKRKDEAAAKLNDYFS